MVQNPDEIVLDEERTRLMSTAGHLLVMGGPGSGKTTIALLKAGNIIEQEQIQPGQKIL
ncbi:UvrD-helicase domain-containing protein, partial [Thiolapillus sp.]